VIKKISLITVAVGAAFVLAGCGGVTKTVDGKAIVQVPAVGTTPAATCYLLEIEVTSDSGGEELEEGFHCVSEAEYNKNIVGQDWVDANGVAK
jgi:hypothetical protein